jgi:import receptor subunit TOM70
MVNKGLALFQSKQDAISAIKLCEEALTIDPENEAAVATLAQLNLQQGNVGEALKMFSRHCELARTEPELTNALTYKYVRLFPEYGCLLMLTAAKATEAQIEFLANYPSMAAQMGQIAQSMMG